MEVSGVFYEDVTGVWYTYEDVNKCRFNWCYNCKRWFRCTGIATGSYRGDGSQLTGISVGITTEAITPSGITTHFF